MLDGFPESNDSPSGMKIIHLDMDCFYAAVEMRERPELAGLPVAVGGGSRRGVVTTCNYEARQFGVRSAMPGFLARERCPRLVFLPVRFDLYRAESAKIRHILHHYTPLVEPLSLDEAYLDVTGSARYAWDIAKEIRKTIFDKTRLTASAGIAPNKMLAKIASEWRKPNGQFAITPERIDAFMRDLPLRKIWGVGPKSAEKFAKDGIHTCGDLQRLGLNDLVRKMGKWGKELYHLCRGRDERLVEPDRVRKSLSTERTYLENLTARGECEQAMDELVAELLEEVRAKAADRRIHKAFVKIKFADFSHTTREGLHPNPTPGIYRTLLAEARNRSHQAIRLLGAGVRFAEEAGESEDSQQWLDF
ncbi:MAG: DNA polymerase IV [Terrimicrobiaceae bacterium]|jgi:DNA polymerase-4|nr:DNA polymerase IV [Terrimicrobiaceae bacterium]